MTQPAQPSTGKPKKTKPFYKRWWFIAIIVLFIVGMIGVALESPETVPDVSGQTATQAKKTLADAGFNSVSFKDEKGHTRTASDDWDAIGTTPKAGAKAKPSKGVTVTVSHERADAEEASRQAAEEASEKAAEESEKAAEESEQAVRESEKASKDAELKKDSMTTAGWVLCQQYAQSQTTDKVKFHLVTGKLLEEVEGDTVKLKAWATLKNAAGAKREVNVECTIKDPEGAAELQHFAMY